MLVGAVAPWLARRIWNRRPPADPGAPPKAQLEVLSDRIGTGLLVASVFGVLAAGLAARPTVVAETDERERAAEELLRFVQAHGSEELLRNLEAVRHAAAGRRLLPQLHPPRRARRLDLLLRGRHRPR